MHALLVWGSHNRSPSRRVFKHAACGTRLDAEGRCPACRLTPAAQDILTESGPPPRASRDDPVALALREPHRLLEPLDVD